MELPILTYTGQDTGKTITLPAHIFGILPKDHLMAYDIKHILANQRQGTHQSKGRSDVKGSTRKLRKQKGTGYARIGSIRSGILRGGGRMFGPHPKDYHFKVNKKIKKLARLSALSYKAQQNHIIILQDLVFSQPKTRGYMDMLKNLGLTKQRSLFVLAKPEPSVVLSSRNIQKTKVITAEYLNTHDLINTHHLIFTVDALLTLEKNFS